MIEIVPASTILHVLLVLVKHFIKQTHVLCILKRKDAICNALVNFHMVIMSYIVSLTETETKVGTFYN